MAPPKEENFSKLAQFLQFFTEASVGYHFAFQQKLVKYQ